MSEKSGNQRCDMFQHGLKGYEIYDCRCRMCCDAKNKRVKRRRISQRLWRKNNLERIRENKRRWRKANPNRIRLVEKLWNWRYRGAKIDHKAYDLLLMKQGCGCAICDRPLAKNKWNIVDGSVVAHLDHDHTTGQVRGLLCGSCNRALGLLSDSPVYAEKMALYLRRTSESH